MCIRTIGLLRGGRTNVGQLPFEIYLLELEITPEHFINALARDITLLELLEALEGNLELVRGGERGGVVEDFDAQERNNRHRD